jgi:hypothetical protein
LEGGLTAPGGLRYFDEFHYLHSSLGQRSQLGAYYTLQIFGKRLGSAPSFQTGPSSSNALEVFSSSDGHTPLAVIGTSSQSANLQTWQVEEGNTVASINNTGSLTLNTGSSSDLTITETGLTRASGTIAINTDPSTADLSISESTISRSGNLAINTGGTNKTTMNGALELAKKLQLGAGLELQMTAPGHVNGVMTASIEDCVIFATTGTTSVTLPSTNLTTGTVIMVVNNTIDTISIGGFYNLGGRRTIMLGYFGGAWMTLFDATNH